MNELERKLLASPSLPTLPSVARRILELFQDSNAELTELANMLQAEPAVSARVMQLVNSGLYHLSREVASLREAVLYLGLNTVRSVALSFSLLSAFQRKGRGEKLLELLWRVSLMRALASRQLATRLGGWDPEEAFLTGLMSSCGALLLYQALPRYREVLERFERGESELIELETSSLETDHGRMAALLLESWHFAPRMLDPIRSCFGLLEPAKESEELRRRGRILRAADLSACGLIVEGFQAQLPWLPRRLSHLTALSDEATADVIRVLPEQFRRAAQVFDIPYDMQLGYEELLTRANRALTQHAVSAERGVQELATRMAEATRKDDDLELDDVTGTLSRGSFERLLEAFHRQARKTRKPIGLVVVGIENWKSIETKAGPAHAHEVLAGVAHRVAGMIRRTDPNARVSEHQLAVLALGCAPKDLAIVAERILLGLEGASNGTALEFAVGLAAAHPHHDGSDPAGFFRSALSAAERAAHQPERMAMA